MAKAITEVAIGAAAIGAAFLIPGAGIAIDGVLLASHAAAVGALVSIGASEVMAGVADALKGNQGGLAVGVTTPIGPWAYLYGTQKVGGVEIFRQSNNNTGSGGTSDNKQLHRVYALACHPCVIGDFQLRIDGKQVQLESNGFGFQSVSPSQQHVNITSLSRDVNGLVTMVLASPIANLDGTSVQITECSDNSFNNIQILTQPNPADNTTFQFVSGGPVTSVVGSGQCWTLYSDYKDKIYVEFLNGNHSATFTRLLAAGTTWGASDKGLGRTLVYVQMGYDETVFPSSIPNVSFVIDGKDDILDPRTGTRWFTKNAALCVADFMSMPVTKGGFGLTIGTDIPTAQLIAAANICDEPVALAGGGTTPRYTCNTFFQLNMTRGAILKQMLSSCAGRISYQGGTYNIFPAAWVGPTLQLTDSDLVGPIRTNPRFSIRDTCNAVKGTYVSPENAYQQADVPPYMQDADHGYVSDPWLAEDNGERIFREANFPCTDNAATAQRLEKIALLRTRFQFRCTVRVTMKAYQAVALDVVQITHPRYTWLNKNFEVLHSRFVVDKSNGAPRLAVELDLAETDSSIYDWSIDEQLTPQGYKQPDNVGNSVCSPPENVTTYSGPGAVINGITYPSTITTGADGSQHNSIYVLWNTPNDANVVYGGHIEIQWQPVGAGTWSAATRLDPSASNFFINGVSDGASYSVRVRNVNVANVPSIWIVAGAAVTNTYGVGSYSGIAQAQGALTGVANSDGTASILVAPFSPLLYGIPCTPSVSEITGLTPWQLWYVYYQDPTFAGGVINPVATQNTADFLNKAGYLLIGSVITPGNATRYSPSTYTDEGTVTTGGPANAYDNNETTCAAVLSNWWSTETSPGPPPTFTANETSGDCTWSGFRSKTFAGPVTLNVSIAANLGSAASMTGGAVAYIGGASTSLVAFTGTTANATYQLTIPAGTDISTVSVEVTCDTPAGTPPGGGSCNVNVYEIWIE